MAKKEKRELSPIRGQFPDRNEIQCKDCMFRKHVEVTIGGKTMDIGAGKSYCEVYVGPPDDNGKPVPIMYNQQKCQYKVKEK